MKLALPSKLKYWKIPPKGQQEISNKLRKRLVLGQEWAFPCDSFWIFWMNNQSNLWATL
jgi:hypothetical protein